MEINIRQADLADAPIIAGYNLRLAEESEGLRLEAACATAGVTAVLQDPAKGSFFVAEVAGAVVGQLMITYEWSDWRNGNNWWIQSVYVQPEFRRAGVFRALFHHVQGLARAQTEVNSVRLYVHEDNVKAIQSYERLGMTRMRYQVFELDVRHNGGG